MSKMEPSALALRVARLQNAIVRDLNDIHIFVAQAIPLLEEARTRHASSGHKKDRRYYVPSVKPGRFARRTDNELRSIYDRFTSQRLYESFLITAVAEFEGFLGRVLGAVIREYPKKLLLNVPGVSACRQVSVDMLFQSSTLEEALDHVITEHIRGVFYAAPKAYLDYLGKVAGVEIADKAFDNYREIKASRDLLVHNDRVVNAVYLEKAGRKARGEAGEAVPVDSDYFDDCLATLKQISGIVKRDVDKAFPRKGAKQTA